MTPATMRSRFITVATLAIAVCLPPACSRSSDDSQQFAREPLVLYTDVWSADPGIDVLARSAELVRATAEAGLLSFYVGERNSYEGFSAAIEGPRRGRDPAIAKELTERADYSKQRPATVFHHLTGVTANDKSIHAVACSYRLYPVRRHPENRTENLSLFPIRDAIEIELENTASSPGQPGVSDSDASRVDSRAHRLPSWNVFGSWKVRKLRFVEYGIDRLPDECADWWQERFPTFTRSPELNALFPPPDFEAPLMPVAPQYPEWISPSHPE